MTAWVTGVRSTRRGRSIRRSLPLMLNASRTRILRRRIAMLPFILGKEVPRLRQFRRQNHMQTTKLLVFLFCALASTALHGDVESDIPARPEKLKFPPLDYEPPRPADYRTQLKSGPIAYVASDRELPLVNIVVYLRAGDYVEPRGKEALAEITGNLMARGGTASKTAEELEERLAFLAANLNSNFGDTQGSVSLNLLAKDLDEGLAILREVLTQPRFQEDRLLLRKKQTLQAMKQRNDDSSDIEGRERDFLALGESFWGNRYPTEASLASISRTDLEQFHKKWIHPGNFV